MSVNIPNPDPHSIYTLVLPGGTPISVRASRAFEPFQPKLLHQTTGCVAYERKIWVNDIGESPDPGYAFMYSKGDGLIFTAEEAAELFITNPAIALGTITMIGYKRRQAFRPHHIMKPPLLLTNVDEKQSIRYFEIVLNGCLAGGFFGWCSFRTHTSEVVKMGALLPSEFGFWLYQVPFANELADLKTVPESTRIPSKTHTETRLMMEALLRNITIPSFNSCLLHSPAAIASLKAAGADIPFDPSYSVNQVNSFSRGKKILKSIGSRVMELITTAKGRRAIPQDPPSSSNVDYDGDLDMIIDPIPISQMKHLVREGGKAFESISKDELKLFLTSVGKTTKYRPVKKELQLRVKRIFEEFESDSDVEEE